MAEDRTLDPRLIEFFGEPISVYTREEALEDGQLVDVTAWASSGPEGMLGGFRCPVALTRPLWNVIDLADGDDDASEERNAAWRAWARGRGESTRGRAHDVLWMLSCAAVRNVDTDRLRFSVLMTAADRRRHRLDLDAVIDGDGITVGFPQDF